MKATATIFMKGTNNPDLDIMFQVEFEKFPDFIAFYKEATDFGLQPKTRYGNPPTVTTPPTVTKDEAYAQAGLPAPQGPAPQGPAPQVPVPASETGEPVQVHSITLDYMRDGTPKLTVKTVKGTKWSNFGLPAYLEVIPEGVDITTMTPRAECPPTPQLSWIVVDPTGKKVSRFVS